MDDESGKSMELMEEMPLKELDEAELINPDSGLAVLWRATFI